MEPEDLNFALQQAEVDKELYVISATEQKVSGSAPELMKISQTSLTNRNQQDPKQTSRTKIRNQYLT
jgi:hypothetical protein